MASDINKNGGRLSYRRIENDTVDELEAENRESAWFIRVTARSNTQHVGDASWSACSHCLLWVSYRISNQTQTTRSLRPIICSNQPLIGNTPTIVSVQFTVLFFTLDQGKQNSVISPLKI